MLTSSSFHLVLGQNQPCNFSVSGQVFDRSTKQPLPSATIQIEGTSLGTVTDMEGHFKIERLCLAEVELNVSFLGYQTLKHHHDYHHPEIEVYLSPSTEMLESIVIEERHTSSGLNTSTGVALDRDQMQLVKGQSLGDIVEKLAGVSNVKTGQNISNPTIHGLSGNRIIIVNNDVRHEYQNWDNDHAPEIDASNLDRIEVIKGAATVRYGPDALGGVILLNPRETEVQSDFDAHLNLIGKSNGKSTQGNLQVAKGFKWATAEAYGSWLRQGDIQAPQYNLTNTGKRETGYGANVRLHTSSELDLKFAYSHFDQELGILRGAINGNLQDLQQALSADTPNNTEPFTFHIAAPKQQIVHDAVKAEIRYLDDRQSAHLRYSYQRNHRKEFDVRRSNDLEIPNINVILGTHVIDGDWSHPKLGVLQGKIGGQLIAKTNSNQPGTNTVTFIPNYNSKNLGIFVIESYISENQTIELGLRFDHFSSNIAGRHPDNRIFRNKITYTSLSGVLGWQKKINESITFSSNFGTAWRPPNIGELYRFGRKQTFIEYGLWRYTVNESGQINSNSVLTENERQVPSEVGYKWINSLEWNEPGFAVNFSLYANLVQNYIFSRPAGVTRTVRGTAPLFIFDQSDVLFLGTDLSAKIKHSRNWESDIGGSYVWADQIRTDGALAGLPPPNVNYGVTWKPKIQWFDMSKFHFNLHYTFKQPIVPRIITVEELLNSSQSGNNIFQGDIRDFDVLDAPNAFFLANIQWSASKGKITGIFRIDNIFNTSYRHYTDRIRYFADDIGRGFVLSFEWDI